MHYGDKLHKSQSAREQARETGLLIREVEWHLNAKLFFDEYPRWEIDGPHWSIILHDMFLHAVEEGRKEGGREVHLMGPSAESAEARPRGRHTHH